MKAFVQAFGGLIGVGLIGLVFIAAMFVADWLMTRSQGKRGDAEDDKPSQ